MSLKQEAPPIKVELQQSWLTSRANHPCFPSLQQQPVILKANQYQKVAQAPDQFKLAQQHVRKN